MFWEIILAVIVGSFFGIITGLTPGIHINLISLLLVTAAPFLLQYTSPIIIAIIIISMAVNHTFLDTIPSVFLGAPESDTALSVLPGHRLLLQGKGYEAVMLTVVGSLGSLILVVAISPITIPVVSVVYPIIKSFIGFILIFASLFLVLRERTSKLWAFITFLLSGCLGLGVLNMPSLENPLFPLLSGLFGTSMLFLSLKDKVRIPKQETNPAEVDKKTGLKALFSSIFAGSICSFMPGLGPAQAAILGSQLTKDLGDKGFLILVGGLNTVNMILSFVALYVLDKARNGAIVAISKILEGFNLNYLVLFLGCTLIVAGIATFLAINISKIFSKFIVKINYQILCLSIISLICVLVFVLSGFLGLFVLFVSTCVGIIPPIKGIGRNHMMGVLILPVILYFVL